MDIINNIIKLLCFLQDILNMRAAMEKGVKIYFTRGEVVGVVEHGNGLMAMKKDGGVQVANVNSIGCKTFYGAGVL